MKTEAEVMKEYAQALADACTQHGGILGPLYVVADLMKKAGKMSSRKSMRVMVNDAARILSWSVKTVSDSLAARGE